VSDAVTTAPTTIRPSSIEDVQEAVLYAAPSQSGVESGATGALRPIGRRTKPALSLPARGIWLDMTALTGVTDYQPEEGTFTAFAGTPVAAVEALLAEHGQGLPFEPPFAARGATLGGTVAAGMNGPGRFRYGGVRDFLIGARFVDGEGRLVRGGGRVVKNAAGFYLHHLLLGSLGRLGVLVEVTFKVFPVPRHKLTYRVDSADLPAALELLDGLRRSIFELEALDLEPPATLRFRLAGAPEVLAARAAALADELGRHGGHATPVDHAEAEAFWEEGRDLAWGEGALAKVAVTPSRIPRLETVLQSGGATRRYSAGGELAWVRWPGEPGAFDRALGELGLSGLWLADAAVEDPVIGVRPDAAFLARVRQALDPDGTFGSQS
jgi:glycolate oxidase FAD binding subunit